MNSVQRHTKCNSGYCLRVDKDGNQACRFNFPMKECTKTYIKYEKVKNKFGGESVTPTLVTQRNDSRLNRHQRLQLQGWRANCDIQLIIDYHSCLEYITKYASKGEKM